MKTVGIPNNQSLRMKTVESCHEMIIMFILASIKVCKKPSIQWLMVVC